MSVPWRWQSDARCLSDTFFWLRDTFGSHLMELGGEAGIGEVGDAGVRSRAAGGSCLGGEPAEPSLAKLSTFRCILGFESLRGEVRSPQAQGSLAPAALLRLQIHVGMIHLPLSDLEVLLFLIFLF